MVINLDKMSGVLKLTKIPIMYCSRPRERQQFTISSKAQ